MLQKMRKLVSSLCGNNIGKYVYTSNKGNAEIVTKRAETFFPVFFSFFVARFVSPSLPHFLPLFLSPPHLPVPFVLFPNASISFPRMGFTREKRKGPPSPPISAKKAKGAFSLLPEIEYRTCFLPLPHSTCLPDSWLPPPPPPPPPTPFFGWAEGGGAGGGFLCFSASASSRLTPRAFKARRGSRIEIWEWRTYGMWRRKSRENVILLYVMCSC